MPTTSVLQAEVLVDGAARGPVVATQQALSFWGGFNPATGKVIDRRHPLQGVVLTDTVFVVPHGKGSSTGSPVLVDALLQGTAPAGIILNRVDEIIALGGLIYQEFFDRTIPIVVLDDAAFEIASHASSIHIAPGGEVLAHTMAGS